MTNSRPATIQSLWLLAWRLWKYHSKRSIGRWLIPIFLGLAVYANRNPSIRETITWVHISAGIGVASVMIAPIAAGIAAWLAVNSRRNGPEELLSVVPVGRFWHDLALVGGLAVWVCATYLLHGIVQGAIAMRQATWGAPDLAPVWIGFLVITVAISIGYALGLLVPSLLTPPLIAIASFLTLVAPYGYKVSSNAPDSQLSPHYLSPYSFLVLEEQAVYLRIWNTVLLPLSGWLIGFLILALAGIIFCSRHTRIGTILVLMAMLLCGPSAYSLMHLPGQLIAIPNGFVPYQPDCVQRAIEVCVHPAYRARLETTASVADAVFKPMSGLTPMPKRLEQFANRRYQVVPSDTVGTQIYAPRSGYDNLAVQFALSIVKHYSSQIPPSVGLSEAQCVIGRWLVTQAGYQHRDSTGFSFFLPTAAYANQATFQVAEMELDAAVISFAQLSDVARSAWFERNLAPLSEGRLSLSDLP